MDGIHEDQDQNQDPVQVQDHQTRQGHAYPGPDGLVVEIHDFQGQDQDQDHIHGVQGEEVPHVHSDRDVIVQAPMVRGD